jgi:hypothetical protein
MRLIARVRLDRAVGGGWWFGLGHEVPQGAGPRILA